MDKAMNKRIVFFVIGTPANGMGHICRSIVLADALKQRGAHVEFVTLQNTPGWARLIKTDYPVRGVAEVSDMIVAVCAGPLDKSVIIDIEHGPDRTMLERAREWFPCRRGK